MDSEQYQWNELHSKQLTQVEERLIAMSGHGDRLTSLEHDRTRVKTALALVTSAVGFLLARLWVLGLVFLGACAATPLVVESPPPEPVEEPAEPEAEEWPSFALGRWDVAFRPVPLVVSSALSDECKDAVFDGWLYWQAQGVLYIEQPVEASEITSAFLSIVVIEEPPPEGAAGATRLTAASNGSMVGAVVTIDPRFCETGQVMSHELGHALGLDHDPDNNDSVMWYDTSGSYELSPEMRAWVQ